MLLYLVSRILSAAGAFVYPTYASYKTLSHRPASETDLERWLMYWSVLGVLLAAEYTAEWTISWIPFYYPAKTLFLLYLALPQTRGASYIYTTQLRPRLAAHEDDIDAAIRRARESSVKWAQRRLQALWNHFARNAGATLENLGGDPAVEAVEGVRGAAAPQPTPRDSVNGPVNLSYGLWYTYVPALMTFLQGPQPPAVPRTQNPPTSSTPPMPVSAHTSALEDSRSILARRRALEAELAALPPLTPSSSIERAASSTYLSAQENDRGRYEEIVHDDADVSVGESGGSGGSGEDGLPPTQRRGSWWWGRSDGYERAKTE